MNPGLYNVQVFMSQSAGAGVVALHGACGPTLK